MYVLRPKGESPCKNKRSLFAVNDEVSQADCGCAFWREPTAHLCAVVGGREHHADAAAIDADPLTFECILRRISTLFSLSR